MSTNHLLRIARDKEMDDFTLALSERLGEYVARLKEIADILDNFYLSAIPRKLEFELNEMQEQSQQYKNTIAELQAEIDSLKG